MSLHRNIISNASSVAVGSAAQLLLIIVLSRLLSIEGFAVFITATAVVGFGEMVSDFGMRIWATRHFSIGSSYGRVFKTALVIKGGFSTLLIAVIVLFPINMLSTEQALLVSLIACTQPSSDPLLWFMRGKERLDIEALVILIWRLSNAIFIGLLAFFKNDVTLLLLIWLLGNVIRLRVEWYLPVIGSLRKQNNKKNKGYESVNYWKVVQKIFPIGIAFIAMALYQRLGVLVLGEISTPGTVAHFGAAFTLVASAGFVATSITVSSFPKLARAVNENDWSEVAVITSYKLRLIILFFLPACIIGIIISPLVINLLYPPSFASSAVAMQALLPGLYISSINFALKYLMNALNHNWLDVVSVVVGIIVFVTFVISANNENLLLIAGIAWGIGELSIFLVKWWVIRRAEHAIRINFFQHLVIFTMLSGLFWITQV